MQIRSEEQLNPVTDEVSAITAVVRPILTGVLYSLKADVVAEVGGREGARRMLAEVLQAEVDAYIAQFADARDERGHRLVVRNGYHQPREVLTSASAVDVVAPRVNDQRTDPDTGQRMRFPSAILPPWARKTPKITAVLPLLYLHGLSSGDFVPALGKFLGSSKGLSEAFASRPSPRQGNRAL